MKSTRILTSVEFCAGAGGQALGLEMAGFSHRLLVDNDQDCCNTLQANRPSWNVKCADMDTFEPSYVGALDLFAAGLPCPPFSIAGKKLGAKDDRNLFPAALRLIEAYKPRFVLIENVRGFLSKSFALYRSELKSAFNDLGYKVDWKLYNSKDFGVCQNRSRVTIVAAQKGDWQHFSFPEAVDLPLQTVGDLLVDLMSENEWEGAEEWQAGAKGIAPTIVGGSKNHGGPDLGPTRARLAWRNLGVNGGSIAETAPHRSHADLPRLTNRMVARIQGFPDTWEFTGKKTAAYRQVGNAFPPPMARALGLSISQAILDADAATSQLSAAE